MRIAVFVLVALAWIVFIRLLLSTPKRWLDLYRTSSVPLLLMLGTIALCGVATWAFEGIGTPAPTDTRPFRGYWPALDSGQVRAVYGSMLVTFLTVLVLRWRWSKRETHPKCGTCDYRLEGVSAEIELVRCPECGTVQPTNLVLRRFNEDSASIDAARNLMRFLSTRRGKRHLGIDLDKMERDVRNQRHPGTRKRWHKQLAR